MSDPAVDHQVTIAGVGFLSVWHEARCSCGWNGDDRYNCFEAAQDGAEHRNGAAVDPVEPESEFWEPWDDGEDSPPCPSCGADTLWSDDVCDECGGEL